VKIGILTFTDGRKRVADTLDADCIRFQSEVANWLRSEGHEPVEATDVVWNYRTAIDGADRLNEKECDAVIFNFCVWTFPDFAAQAALRVDAPILFLGNINPRYPGWVAFFAATLPC
jgi:L-fucose isomerase